MLSQIVSKYGKRVIVPAVLALSGVLYLFLQQQPTGQPVAHIQPILEQPTELLTEPNASEVQEAVSSATPQTLFVDVKGAVRYPGVYELTSEQRVVDAIEAAGGLTEEANAQLLNNAQKLQDEMAIYVPRIGEELADIASVTTVQVQSEAKSGLLNINEADESMLTTLPGIGPAKAQAIIAYRQEHGPFRAIDELKNISGIGDKTFEKFQHLITTQ